MFRRYTVACAIIHFVHSSFNFFFSSGFYYLLSRVQHNQLESLASVHRLSLSLLRYLEFSYYFLYDSKLIAKGFTRYIAILDLKATIGKLTLVLFIIQVSPSLLILHKIYIRSAFHNNIHYICILC